MLKGLFIIATNTDVGKTYVTSRLIKQLSNQYNIAYYKACMSGVEIVDNNIVSSDLKYVSDYTKLKQTDVKVSYTYNEAYSPHLAARINHNFIDLETVKKDLNDLASTHDLVIIEGSGGIICPLKDDEGELIMLTDVIKQAGYPLIIVTSSGLGSINDAVLTASYAKSLNLNILGFIMNNFDKDNIIHCDNYKMIEKLTGLKILGYLEKNGDIIKKDL